MMELLLGSQSPRRREILSFFSIPFRQVASNFDEESFPLDGSNPASYAKDLSIEKGKVLAKSFPEHLILTADTIVYRRKKIYNKPRNAEEAFQMLKELSGTSHTVCTGLCLRKGEKFFADTEETTVWFQTLTEDQIHTYHKHICFLDKAGGYAIQNGGCILVEKIEGCFYNVMGLPIQTLKKLLLAMDIDLWHYLGNF